MKNKLLLLLALLMSAVFLVAWTTESGDILFRGRVQFDGPVVSTDSATLSGVVSAEQLTSTDDATVTDDLSVGGDAAVTGTISTAVGLDAVGAVDMDYGSADVTDHTFVSDGGTVIIDGTITMTDGNTIASGGTLDAVGAVDMDYGSADITDHTFTTDGTGDAEIVLPDDSIGDAEIAFDEVTGADLTLTDCGQISSSAAMKTSAGLGAANGTGVAATEYGDGNIHKTVLTLTDVSVALTDEAGTIAWLGQKIYDFPEGAVMIVGATSDLDLTLSAAGVNADWDGDFGLGSATAANDADLTSTEDDILPKTATPQAVTSATTANGQSTSAENIVFDGTTTALDLYLNLLVDDADHDVTSTPTNMIFNGTITIAWFNLGDY